MLDINLFREDKGGNLEVPKESQRRRYADEGAVEKVVQLDEEWRKARYDLDQSKKALNKLSKDIGAKFKAKEDATEMQEESRVIKEQIGAKEDAEEAAAKARDSLLGSMGNLVHDSVPVHDDEDNNVVVKTFGEKGDKKPYNHVDLVQLLDIADLENGTAVAGGRGYFLKGAGVLLNQALINFALQHAYKRGSTPVQTPFFMRQSIMKECAQLEQFDEELYHVTGEGEDKYLIATSEQPLCAMHRQQWFEKADLPKKIVGYSTCFRKEAGSHGRDTLGIFRVHQFEKVEQFIICSPEGDESWQLMEEMIGSAEEFYQLLGLPYRVVNIVSGELNNAAAKKYDLEAWFPAGEKYRELVSCSNCTDYQSRRLDIRMRNQKTAANEGAKQYVHMLNSTLTATERTLCCVLENYQTEDGIRVPECLQPFMMGIEFVPFVYAFDKKRKLTKRPDPAPAASETMSTGQ